MRASNQFADVTTGVVYIHASPAAVCPHVEWALSSTLAARPNLKWTRQPAMPGQLRAVTNWVGPVGTGARLANALRSWSVLRFEVTEDPSAGVDGHRFMPHAAAGTVERRDERQRRRDDRRDAAADDDGRRRRRAGRRTGFGTGHARGTRHSRRIATAATAPRCPGSAGESARLPQDLQSAGHR